MLWGNREVARELSRQLVELAAIRKRVPQDSEIAERVQRLEASHHLLLRKLAATQGKRRRSRSGRDAQRLFHDIVRRSLSFLIGRCEGGGGQPPAGTATRVATRLPHLGERCAACGKALLSGVLAGEEVTLREGSWYHRACVAGGQRYERPGTLN